MANNNENIHYTVSVDVKKAEAEVNSLRESVNGLREAFEKSDKRKKESREISKSLIVEEQKLAGAERNLAQAVNASAGAHRNSTKAINDQIQALVRENSTIDMNSQKYRDNQKEIARYANKMNQATGATGGVTSATMELSRVVSDAPYGIRGVANNLSQFTSQMYYASAAAGGLGKAFKQMWASLMGPLGIVLAITIAISALDFFAGSAKKAEEEADDLDSTLGGLASTLDGLNLSQKETNERIVEYIELKKLKKKVEEEDKDMQEKLLAIEEERTKAETSRDYNQKQMNNEDISQKMRDRAKDLYDAAVTDLELLVQKERVLNNISLKNNEEYLAAKEAIGRGGEKTLLLYNQELSALEEVRESMSKNSDEYDKYTDLIIAKQKQIDAITGGDPKKGPKGPAFKAGKNMSSKEIDFTAENRKNNEAELLAMAIHESQKRKIRDEFEVEALEDKKDAFVEQRNQALENFVAAQELRKENNKDNLKIQEDADRLIFEAYRTANEDILEAEEEHGDALLELKKKQKEKEREQRRKDAETAFDLEEQIRQNEILQASYQESKSGNTIKVDTFDQEQEELEERRAFEAEKLENFVGSSAELLAQRAIVSDLETEIFVNQAEREMEIEQAKHDFRNAMFDQTRAGFAAMSRMMKKGSDEAKAFALLEIAAGTAQGMINGLIIAQDTAGKDGPMSGLTFPMYYASQVGAVLGAAARAKSILQGGPASSPSTPTNGGGGGDSGFKPEFNIVGNSNQNQLAQSIGDQNNAPVRAYVVYEDVSEAEGIASGSEEAAGI